MWCDVIGMKEASLMMDKVICNPLNLEYRYQIRKILALPFANDMPFPSGANQPGVFREAADPTVLLFKGVYYLYASMSGGFWYSDDLCDWLFKETPELPIYDYAPDVREIDGSVVFTASKSDEPCSFYRSEDPLTKPFESINTTFPFWDPNLFQDDDGRVYLYWGYSSSEPIYGVQVDRSSFAPLGERLALINENEVEHGWERRGENNVIAAPSTPMEEALLKLLGTKPFIEGAYMTKNNGLYYLQYAAPGTEHNVYCDGAYVSDSPLGPFTYQRHNPFSSKPGGFINAAGHGSTFQDKHGNWWHASTVRISVNNPFERRIGLFPCYFDSEGLLHCDQTFADYPFALPTAARPYVSLIEPKWMLLSYEKVASASSSQPEHEPDKGTDENIRTWWAADAADDKPWYQLDLGEALRIHAVQVNFHDYHCIAPDVETDAMHEEQAGVSYRTIIVESQRTKYLLEYTIDGAKWSTLIDRRDSNTDYAHDFAVMDTAMNAKYLRVSNIKLPFGGTPAISGLRVFGKGNGNMPDKATSVTASRENDIDIVLNWQPSKKAVGYNVRYGISPTKLYSSWQVYGANDLRLSMVNKGADYYVAVDSFNENGVTEGDVVHVE
jgi:hypothetical protein